ncbi:Uncharacterized protein TCAP_06959, partial [Tolypocladium capitatum]
SPSIDSTEHQTSDIHTTDPSNNTRGPGTSNTSARMKFFALTIASLASIAAASPTGNQCTPVAYQCATNAQSGIPGWNVCNVNGQWVYGGDCPPNTVCVFDTANGSPYCVPPGFQFP